MSSIGLIEKQIMWNRLLALVEEQAQVLQRTAFSTIVAGDDLNTAYVVGRIAAGPAAVRNAFGLRILRAVGDEKDIRHRVGR